MRPPTRFRTAVAAALLGLLAAFAVPGGDAPAQAADDPATTVGTFTGFDHADGVYRLSAGKAVARVTFVSPETFRLELAPDGTFTDPTGKDIVLPQGRAQRTKWREKSDRYEFSTSKVTLRAYKSPLRFALYRADGTRLWAETKGLSWTKDTTTQSLARGADEQFYGAGMQNGRGNTSHRGKKVEVAVDYNWNDGGHPNSVPFYLSSAGYGVFRSTYAPNTYDFAEPVTATAKEQRFDAYYFAGRGSDAAKDVIGQYTKLTGRPFLPPVYGLEIGDADCYLHNANRGERRTLDALKVADGYVEHDMPNGWMLVNDGYGCGYENLAETSKGLAERKMKMGLWTEDGLDKIAEQVKAGQRVAKLDVAWVGDGYKKALDGCKDAYRGIEDNSDARGFTWAPESWSGAQRCGVQWSGDQSGSWEYIRWQIPTYAGSTMSGLAYTTGDVDGIFGGSPKTYVRDLQWKMFLPVTMTMDGWAASDKQPFRYGEPYTSINRKYLKLHESLLPYLYSYAHEATETGVGAVRPLALEYPDDPKAATDAAKYEFLTGKDFLVAPVYQDTTTRDGIYLPKGTWTDYWSGRTYQGPTTIDGYSAPLDTLPLFVRGGASVPMWPGGIRSYEDRKPDSPLAWDIYPQGKSSFELYEDDGVTRRHRDGAYATQRADVRARRSGAGGCERTDRREQGTLRREAERPALRVHAAHRGRPEPRGAGRPRAAAAHVEGRVREGGAGLVLRPGRPGRCGARQDGSPAHRPRLRTDPRRHQRVGGACPGLPPPSPCPRARSWARARRARSPSTSRRARRTDDEVTLDAPEGWTAVAATAGTIPAGTTRRVEVALTPGKDAKPGEQPLTARVRHRSAGQERTAVQRFALGVMPEAPGKDTWASDMVWLTSTNGYGPAERDRSNGESGAADGRTLTLAGKTYEKGIGVHADSVIEVYPGGRCTRFTADVGIDDEINGYGEVAFSVEADGKVLWTSPKVTGASATVPVDVDVRGARHVELKVKDTNGSKSGDHADWAAAGFRCA